MTKVYKVQVTGSPLNRNAKPRHYFHNVRQAVCIKQICNGDVIVIILYNINFSVDGC